MTAKTCSGSLMMFGCGTKTLGKDTGPFATGSGSTGSGKPRSGLYLCLVATEVEATLLQNKGLDLALIETCCLDYTQC